MTKYLQYFYLFVTLLCINDRVIAQTTYLSQDFSGSSTVSDYVSSTPNSGQFNAISNSSGTVAISGGQLGFTRTSASGSGIIARTTDFSPEPQVLKVQFDLTVDSSSMSQTSAATLQIGQGFTTSTAVPANSNIHSKIGINFTGNNGEFSLRNIGSSTSSSVFSGQQTITWYINNSGTTYSYTAPDGSSQSLANDAADVYVGTTNVFNDIAATTGTVALTDFKFVFNGGSGSALGGLRLDNISITSPADAPLPVEFGGFELTALPNSSIQLSWATASELNNAGFEIYRSESNDKAFKKIASYETNSELIGMGTNAYGKKYSFIDNSDFLQSGNTYWYKVVSVDFDGTRNSHEAKSIEYNSFQNIDLKSSAYIYPNPTADYINISFSIAEDQKITVIMSDITGKTVYSTQEDHPSGNVHISISTGAFPLGIYNVVIKTRDNIYTHIINVSR
jgi:hypothetical protein